jgi:hypothetical protein
MISIDIKDADVSGALDRAALALTDMTPLIVAIVFGRLTCSQNSVGASATATP